MIPRTSSMNQLRVLFIPSWYPVNENDASGIFVKQMALAASLYEDVTVLHVHPDPYLEKGYLSISESQEGGIRTIKTLFRWCTEDNSEEPASDILRYLFFKAPLLQKLASKVSAPWLKDSLLGLCNLLVTMIAFKKLIKFWHPDIIHAHVYTAGLPSLVIGKLYHIPVVISEHSSEVLRKNFNPIRGLVFKFVMKRADMVLPVSSALGNSIRDIQMVRNCKVVPNTIDVNKLETALEKYVAKPRKHKNMLVVGNLKPDKGIEVLLHSIAKIRKERNDFILDIVGDGPSRYDLENLTKTLNIQDVVRFHGFLPHEDMHGVFRFMRDCDFLILPSLYETFSVVCIEAMAHGKPIVATTSGGPEEIINEEIGILVPVRDEVALAHAIAYMLDNHQRYSSLRIAQVAKDRYSYEAVGRVLSETYHLMSQEYNDS